MRSLFENLGTDPQNSPQQHSQSFLQLIPSFPTDHQRVHRKPLVSFGHQERMSAAIALAEKDFEGL